MNDRASHPGRRTVLHAALRTTTAFSIIGAATWLLPSAGWTQQPPPAPAAAVAAASPPLRLRGTLLSVEPKLLVLKERNGETLRLARAEKMPVSEVFPIALADIRPGSYVGAAAMPQPDGTQKALEVLVFPEAARGTGEGFHPWDLQPESTMTNATVASLAPAPATVQGGRELRLSYRGGEKTVLVPPGVPIVSIRPSDDSLLVPGANVMITAQDRDGTPTALRVLAGRNGFAPPM